MENFSCAGEKDVKKEIQIESCGGPYHESHFCQAWKR